MINPWTILAAVIAWIGSCGVAYLSGSKHARDEIAAEVQRAQRKAIDEHAANVVIDMQAAAEVERKRGAAALAAASRRYATEVDIERRKAARAQALAQAAKSGLQAVPADDAVACALDPASLGVLVDTIRAANNSATAAAVVPASVSTDTGTGGRTGSNDSKMDR